MLTKIKAIVLLAITLYNAILVVMSIITLAKDAITSINFRREIRVQKRRVEMQEAAFATYV